MPHLPLLQHLRFYRPHLAPTWPPLLRNKTEVRHRKSSWHEPMRGWAACQSKQQHPPDKALCECDQQSGMGGGDLHFSPQPRGERWWWGGWRWALKKKREQTEIREKDKWKCVCVWGGGGGNEITVRLYGDKQKADCSRAVTGATHWLRLGTLGTLDVKVLLRAAVSVVCSCVVEQHLNTPHTQMTVTLSLCLRDDMFSEHSTCCPERKFSCPQVWHIHTIKFRMMVIRTEQRTGFCWPGLFRTFSSNRKLHFLCLSIFSFSHSPEHLTADHHRPAQKTIDQHHPDHHRPPQTAPLLWPSHSIRGVSALSKNLYSVLRVFQWWTETSFCLLWVWW